ncbi:putative metallopeptidase [Achromobacter xylosoxidans]|uniref:putative metallopeptidase n=1 Tax=Alcaligenes xylosoxydans xylosoxydans TaxID=85698 RepID=UPI001EEA7E7D|nr:putative metallopeptidase [Achromobacter xylosoxidans]
MKARWARSVGKERPGPPDEWLARAEVAGSLLAPAPELLEWTERAILAAGGPLYNPDHAHLVDADLAFLWASSGFQKAGRMVLGQAEQVMFRASGWQKVRQEQQMFEWFGRVRAFLITLAADYCTTCSDAEFCALVEHELYHIGHAPDPYGAPAFDKQGRPKLRIVGHDVEEFVGVVARYGPTADVRRLVAAASAKPAVSTLSMARACGCCLRAA